MNVDGRFDHRRPPGPAGPSPVCVDSDLEFHGTVACDRRPGDRDSHRVHAGPTYRLVQQDRGLVRLGVAVAAVMAGVAVMLARMPRGIRARHGLNRSGDRPENDERRYDPHD